MKTTRTLRLILSVLGAACGVALSGCGGDGSGGDGSGAHSCPLAACGGELEGTWDVDSVCMDVDLSSAFEQPECKSAFKPPRLDLTGFYEFRADTTMSYDVAGTMAMPVTIGDACAEALAGESVELSDDTCANFAFFVEPPAPYDSFSCAFSGGACQCEFTGPFAATSEGPYTATGTTFLDSDGDSNDYCVDGDILQLGTDGMTVTLSRR